MMGKLKDVKLIHQQNTSDTWVVLFKDQDINDWEKNKRDIVAVRHPGTGKRAMFIFDEEKDTIEEILSVTEPKRSWFLNNSVYSNENLYLSTAIDPLFLVLPYLQEHCSKQASPLDNIIKDIDFPEVTRLLKCCTEDQLNLIADRRGSSDLNAYKYNEEKTLQWLVKKIEMVSKLLKTKNVHVGFGAVSATFIKSEKCEPSPQEDYTKYAFGIVTEYISNDLSQVLQKYLNIPDESDSHKRKYSVGTENESKKFKLEKEYTFHSELSNYVSTEKLEKPKVPSAKDKAWVKAASGTKSISSFFKKK